VAAAACRALHTNRTRGDCSCTSGIGGAVEAQCYYVHARVCVYGMAAKAYTIVALDTDGPPFRKKNKKSFHACAAAALQLGCRRARPRENEQFLNTLLRYAAMRYKLMAGRFGQGGERIIKKVKDEEEKEESPPKHPKFKEKQQEEEDLVVADWEKHKVDEVIYLEMTMSPVSRSSNVSMMQKFS